MMPTLDDVLIARQYLAGSEQRLKRAVENMQAGFPLPEGWSPRTHVVSGKVGFWKYSYPEMDKGRGVFWGLGFKPVDEGDYALCGFTRYKNQSVGDPTEGLIGDGFYAFVSIYASSEECGHVPGFTENRWYERRQDGNPVKADNGPAVDSRGWWYWFYEESKYAYYARLSPLQDLLDDDGRLDRNLRSWTDDAWKKAAALWNALSLGGGWGE